MRIHSTETNFREVLQREATALEEEMIRPVCLLDIGVGFDFVAYYPKWRRLDTGRSSLDVAQTRCASGKSSQTMWPAQDPIGYADMRRKMKGTVA